jgi:hypothetical protein
MLISFPILKGNDAHLIRKKTFEKKTIVILNMQKDFWNIINLHQVLNNESLRGIEIDNPIYCASLMSFQRYKIAPQDCLPW